MLRKVVSHPLFYIVLLGACVMLVLSARSVKGWSWLGVWTAQKQNSSSVYQQKSFVDDSVIGVTMLHLELTQRWSATTISFTQAIEALQKSDALIANNVINYLQNASNRRLALQTYTSNVGRVVAQSQQAMGTLQADRDNASQQYQQCASDKSAADNQFFQWLRTIDGGMLQQGYDDALRYGTCETTSRISVNAYQSVITKMQSYTTALEQVNNILTTNEDLIVANVDLFEDSYLEQLIQIRDNLSVLTKESVID